MFHCNSIIPFLKVNSTFKEKLVLKIAILNNIKTPHRPFVKTGPLSFAITQIRGFIMMWFRERSGSVVECLTRD